MTPPSPIEEALKVADMDCECYPEDQCYCVHLNSLAAEVRRYQAQEKAVEGLVELREAERALLDFYIYSRPTGHGCQEPEKYCLYCHYGRIRSKNGGDILINEEHTRLFNARGAALAAVREAKEKI